jgi:hypothetical protein
VNPWWAAGVVVALLLISVLLGRWVVERVLRRADRWSRRDGADGSAGSDGGEDETSADGPDGPRARSRLRGGTWIGALERLAVTGVLLAGEPSGIAVVVAVKGLGRYPELRNGSDPGVSERFVIGTLASLVWSGALGLLGRWLLTR